MLHITYYINGDNNNFLADRSAPLSTVPDT